MTRSLPVTAAPPHVDSSHRAHRPAWLAAALLAVALTACSGAPMTPSSSAGSASRPPFQTMPPLPSASPGTPAQVSPARWQAILADLAARGLPTDAITIEAAERVTWPSSALGCPSPGRVYTQALVEGLRVVVLVDDQRFDYRFGNGDTPKLCER